MNGYNVDSGSARYNAEQVAKTVQARIESNKTSQSIAATQYLSIYSREPNRRNSVYIGNMTWVRLHLLYQFIIFIVIRSLLFYFYCIVMLCNVGSTVNLFL